MKQRRIRYTSEIKTHVFLYDEDEEIFTRVELFYKTVPPDYGTWDSPDDYYGYTDLTDWKVISVENSEGDEVDSEEVLTEKQLQDYNAAMLNFVEK